MFSYLVPQSTALVHFSHLILVSVSLKNCLLTPPKQNGESKEPWPHGCDRHFLGSLGEERSQTVDLISCLLRPKVLFVSEVCSRCLYSLFLPVFVFVILTISVGCHSNPSDLVMTLVSCQSWTVTTASYNLFILVLCFVCQSGSLPE